MKRFTYGTTPKKVIIKAVNKLPGKRYDMELNKTDYAVFAKAVNQGIDSHLEAVTDVDLYHTKGQFPKAHASIGPESLACVLRRLGESEDENANSLRTDILSSLNIEEV